ncbi:DUF4422 domain-containing protein [Turicimonas muris]|uniref:DUF4422 domain-containing protein n=1 Tax=Turicimonas muris TaxID=1796652 RepID=UPI0032B2994F
MKKKLAICTVYHRPAAIPKDSSYKPILVGSKVLNQASKDGFVSNEEWKAFIEEPGLLMDGEGEDNLSDLNRYVNEMSGIYWVWKNYDEIGSPEIIGLSHYRRFFIFNESLPLPSRTWLPNSSCFIFDSLESAAPYFDSSFISHFFDIGFDCLTTKMYDARLLEPARSPNVASCEERFYEIADFDPALYKEMERLVLQAHPEYLTELENLRKAPSHYTFNMFVMKKELFLSYCNFIFPILRQLALTNSRTDNPTLMRAPGYLSEFLTSIFLSNRIRLHGLKVKELNTCYIENTQFKPKGCNGEKEIEGSEDSFSTREAVVFSIELMIYLVSLGKVVHRDKIDKKKYQWRRAKSVSYSSNLLKKGLNFSSRCFSRLSNILRV